MAISRRDFLKWTYRALLSVGLTAISGYSYTHIIEPDWLSIDQLIIPLPRLVDEFRNFRIVQISDIHLDDRWMTLNRLAKCVQVINQFKADLIVFTGDLLTRSSGLDIQQCVKVLSNLSAKYGVFAVLGNHDHWVGADLVLAILSQSGITPLNNEFITLYRSGKMFHIAGLNDVWEGHDRLWMVLRGLPKEGAAIIMVHEPDIADQCAASERFDLQLSGHSHGGQVIFPGYGPIILPLYAKKYPLGLRRIRNMLQYTNRGLGMIQPYVRFNCRPEITVFQLMNKFG